MPFLRKWSGFHQGCACPERDVSQERREDGESQKLSRYVTNQNTSHSSWSGREWVCGVRTPCQRPTAKQHQRCHIKEDLKDVVGVMRREFSTAVWCEVTDQSHSVCGFFTSGIKVTLTLNSAGTLPCNLHQDWTQVSLLGGVTTAEILLLQELNSGSQIALHRV